MFDFLKKKKPEMPVFDGLRESEYRDKYFYRTSPWDWLNDEMIHVFDLNAPRVITMDPFPQLVYLEAIGQETVSEFVYATASKYSKKEGIPEQLDLGILEALDSQISDGLIKLSDTKKQLENSILFSKSDKRSN